MKASLFILALAVAAQASAQSTAKDQTLKTDNAQKNRPAVVSLAPVTTQASAEIKHGRVTYGGPVVAVARTKNPLELINPLAPLDYNSNIGDSRVSHDLLTGRPNGTKLLMIRF